MRTVLDQQTAAAINVLERKRPEDVMLSSGCSGRPTVLLTVKSYGSIVVVLRSITHYQLYVGTALQSRYRICVISVTYSNSKSCLCVGYNRSC